MVIILRDGVENELAAANELGIVQCGPRSH